MTVVAWDMIDEAVSAALAEIKLKDAELDFRRWRQPASDQVGFGKCGE